MRGGQGLGLGPARRALVLRTPCCMGAGVKFYQRAKQQEDITAAMMRFLIKKVIKPFEMLKWGWGEKI